MEVKTHSCQPDVATGKSKSEGNNESEGDFHNTGQIILLIRSYKEAPVSFGTILSVYIVLTVIGIFVNGAVSLVMLRGKRFKKNASNFFIFNITFTELAIRLVLFPLLLHSLLSTEGTEIFQCKILTLFSNTFSSVIFVSLLAIALDRYCNIIYPMKSLKKKRKLLHLVFLVWLYAVIITCPFVVSVKTISVSEIPEAKGMECENCTPRKLCDIPQNLMGQFSTVSYFIFAFLLPVTVIFLLYTKIAICLHKRSNNGMAHKVAARTKSKAVRMLILTVFGYMLSLGPAAVYAMVRSCGYLNGMSFGSILKASWAIKLVTLTSSLGNPVIYSYYNGDFRKEFVKSCFSRKNNNSTSFQSIELK